MSAIDGKSDVSDRARELIEELAEYGGNDEQEGFWQIVEDGLHLLKLEGAPLLSFIDDCVRTLQARGCIPCDPGGMTYDAEWVSHPGLGDTPDEIRAKVIGDWLASGGGLLPPWTCVWFGLPEHVVPIERARRLSSTRPRTHQIDTETDVQG